MKDYNMRIYYYYAGTQYRIYSRPVRFLADAEKEMRKKRREEKTEEQRKLEEYKDKLARNKLIFCPFENEYIEYREVDEIVFNEKNAKHIKSRSERASLNRSKQNLIGICRANKWDYMVTFTFNPRKVDRSNYEEVCKKACKWFNNMKERNCPNMKYVLVPELHKDGVNYHLHGLIADCEGLSLRVSGKFDKKGRIVYNLPDWEYGWNSATEVGHSGKASNYISKYITKDTEHLLKGKKRYWASQNCVLAKEVCDEVLVEDYEEAIEMLAPYTKYIKNIRVPQCGRNIVYIET